MTRPAPQPEPRRKQGQQPATPGIINDLPARPAAGASQSMIINDIPAQRPASGQQMIVNDLPAQPGGPQMIVGGVPQPQQMPASQQMIVNDMAFNDLVQGLEALSRGQVAGGGGQMIINDVTSAAQPQRPAPQPQPQPRPAPAAAPPHILQQQMAAQQAAAQRPQPAAMPQPAPQGAPRPMPTNDARLLQQQAAGPQPMVINTPQPLVKPRRDEGPGADILRQAAAGRLPQQPAARPPAPVSAGAPPEPAPAAKNNRGASTPRKTAARTETARAKTAATDEWSGSYSGRTMAPSLVLCVAWSALCGWVAFNYLPSHWWFEFLAATAGFVWVVQLVRWAYRVLGYRYRITPEHVRLHRGLLYGKPIEVPRYEIVTAKVSASIVERILGVGKIVVETKSGKTGPVELEGVRHPRDVLQLIDPKKK